VSLLAAVPAEIVWVVARSTGVAALVALSLSLLTGMALRPKTLGWLSSNRAISELHTYATVLWLPLGIAHVVALLVDPYAKVGLRDLVVPFAMSYGTFAIGLGTISVQLLIVVLVAAWSRTRLSRGQWLAFHRVSYLAFAAAFLHGVLSGTDLAYPWLMGIAWLVAAILALAGVRRIGHALRATERPALADARAPGRTKVLVRR
jgi:sulfoxide reductase heme-binding subunit YedZ